MELTSEDALRLNVLLANGAQAIRIDEADMTLYALTARGEAAIPLHPEGRKETYLRLVRELLSGHALGSPGGFPVYLRNWTRSGQPMGDNLDKLLLLGEPEAVVSVAYSPKLTADLARLAWWALPVADNARRMLERECVADAPIGKVLADHLIEHLPFESSPHIRMDTVRIVLHPGLIDEGARLRLWNKASGDNAFYVPFLLRAPDDLPGGHSPHGERESLLPLLTSLAQAGNPWAALLLRVMSGSGQAFLRAAGEVVARPADQDVAGAAFNAVAGYFAAVRVRENGFGNIDALLAEAEALLDNAAAGEVLAQAPALRDELRAMLLLAHIDAELARSILSRTTAAGTLLRRKLEPLTAPMLRQMALLRGIRK